MISEPLRVLVADDQVNIATTLRDIFVRAGYHAEAVFSGNDAAEAARSFRPDILVIDHSHHPESDGLAAAVAIKQMLPGIRVIVLSPDHLRPEFGSLVQAGYSFTLVAKPVHPVELLQIVREEFSYQRSRRPAKVLNVDDVEPNRYSITRLLSRAGFQVTEAANGRETFLQVSSDHPDLVLLDIHLPDIDGYEICKLLKANPETSDIAVVHLTSTAKNAGAEARSRTVGADGYLTHPMAPAFLVSRVRDLLQAKFLRYP